MRTWNSFARSIFLTVSCSYCVPDGHLAVRCNWQLGNNNVHWEHQYLMMMMIIIIIIVETEKKMGKNINKMGTIKSSYLPNVIGYMYNL